MSRNLFFFFLITLALSCTEKKHQQTVEETFTMASLESVEDTVQEKDDNVIIPVKKDKKLRYLFASNGGMVGYYDDGTVVGCPHCDLLEENIKAMAEDKPLGTYIVINDTTLYVNNKYYEYPRPAKEDEFVEWVMIDYKWTVKDDKDILNE